MSNDFKAKLYFGLKLIHCRKLDLNNSAVRATVASV